MQDHPPLTFPLRLQNEDIEVVDRFTYLGSCISNCGDNHEDVSARIVKARLAFANLRYLWRQKGISLKLRGRVYNTTVRGALLYASKTLTLLSEDLQRLLTFDQRCLRSVACISQVQRISNEEVRKRVFGEGNQSDSLDKRIGLHKLRWLGHVLRMPSHRLPNRVIFSQPSQGWRRSQGGQKMTW